MRDSGSESGRAEKQIEMAKSPVMRRIFLKYFEKVLTIHQYRCIINIEIKKGSNQNGNVLPQL